MRAVNSWVNRTPAFLALVVSLVSFGCGNKNSNTAASETPTTKNTLLFKYSDNLVEQTLHVTEQDSSGIKFSLLLKKKDGTCKSQVSGIAVNNYKGSDPEIDEDENGVAYPANEFVYNEGECHIAIRIAMDEMNKAKIKASGCNDPCYPGESAVLRLDR